VIQCAGGRTVLDDVETSDDAETVHGVPKLV
jgi:hypothetical protein